MTERTETGIPHLGDAIRSIRYDTPTKGERGAMTYQAEATGCNGRRYRFTYTVGIGIIDRWLHDLPAVSALSTKPGLPQWARKPGAKKTVDGHAAYEKHRDKYIPDDAEVIACLFMDASSVEGHEDWISWAEEFGILGDAKALRKAQDGFAKSCEAERFLRACFGQWYDEAMQAAQER